MNKTILFILGCGHSGTTVLDLTIASLKGCFSLGEISTLPVELKKNTFCVCGQRISACNFWSKINQAFMKYHIDISLLPDETFDLPDPMTSNRSRASWKRKLGFNHQMIFPNKKNKDWNRRVSQLYKVLFDISGAQVLIDSSKNVKRALLLKKLFDRKYTIKFLHITRDGRGVAHSYKKTHYTVAFPGHQFERFQSAEVLPVKDSSKIYAKINLRILLSLLMYTIPTERRRIRYEDLCRHPEIVLKEMADWLQVDLPRHDLRQFKQKTHHTVGGNPSRFNSQKIGLPFSGWKKTLSKEELTVFMKNARWINRIFGYN